MSRKEIEKILELSNKNIKNNVKILSNKDLETDYVLRIDSKIPKNNIFFPLIAKSQAISEDRTLPRITASKYLLGCILAIPYIKPENNFNPAMSFEISSIDFDYCLKPNKNLVFDADETDEVWLITYNKDTLEYKTKKAGEIILNNYTVIPSGKKNILPKTKINIYVHITKNEGIYFNKKIKLEKGYYSISFFTNKPKLRYYEATLDDDIDKIEIEELKDIKLFEKAKKRSSLEALFISNLNKLKNW